jgi:hypothetical protein
MEERPVKLRVDAGVGPISGSHRCIDKPVPQRPPNANRIVFPTSGARGELQIAEELGNVSDGSEE